MNHRRASHACAPLLALSVLAFAGCALTSRGAVLTPRYFSPNLEQTARAAGEPALTSEPTPANEPELRLGQVEAASDLEERMAYRVSPAELGYYEDRRWTEEPYDYLRRALERELFERRHVRRVLTGDADTLDVELTAFEELRTPAPSVRLALSFTLHDEHDSLLEQSFAIERPLAPGADTDHAARVAEALGAALGDAVRRVSDLVIAKLHAPSAACDSDSDSDVARAPRPALGSTPAP